ncbi:MAG: hypothetical protein ACOX9B_03535 [Candidatus Xenobium sp.]
MPVNPAYNEASYVQILNQAPMPPLSSLFLGLVLAAATAAVSSLARWSRRDELVVGLVLTLLLCLNFVPRVQQISPELLQHLDSEPAAGTYIFDGVQLLKAYHLFRGGMSYYEAHRDAIRGDARKLNPRASSLRFPALFYAWSFLPAPHWIAYLAWALVLIAMLSSYLSCASRGSPAAAVVAPVLLGAWFLYASSNWWMIFADYWAGLLVLFFLCSWRANYRGLSLILLFSAAMVREFAALFLLAGASTFLMRPSQRRLGMLWIGTLVLVVVLYLLHGIGVKYTLGETVVGTFTLRLGSPSAQLATGLTFGSPVVVARDFVMPVVLLLAFSSWHLRRDSASLLLVAGLVLNLVLMAFMIGESTPYYGFNLIPSAILGSAWSLAAVLSEGDAPVLHSAPLETVPSAAGQTRQFC